MATKTGNLDSTQYASSVTSTPSSKLKAAERHGVLRRAYAKFDVAAGDIVDANGLIRMFTLPKGSTLVNSWIVSSDMGTTGTYQVGWNAGADGLETADPDGLFSAVDSNAAAVNSRSPASTLFLLATGFNKQFADTVNIEIDITQASDIATAISFELECWYVVD